MFRDASIARAPHSDLMTNSLLSAAPRFAEPDDRWTAVLARDASADGHFVYAVRSTRIYCRASCPSRRPGRERVTFFDSPADAAVAGYRACRRCVPDRPATDETRVAAAVRRARALLDAAADAGRDRIPLAALASATGVSVGHLQRAFTRAVGVSPARYAAAQRAARWKVALRSEGSVSRATYAAGYAAASRAYASADAHLGMTPAAYRRGGAGVRLWWTPFDTGLGRALAAATARGVCAVLLARDGEDDTALEAALATEYPTADRRRADDAPAADDEARTAYTLLAAAVAAVRAQADGARGADLVPVDAAGTPWQRRVWDALRAIPAGETRTYGELAVVLGHPTAARAVARACATNRVALLVPCHRVVPAGAAARGFAAGAVSGYRWGPARKAQLLAAERDAARG